MEAFSALGINAGNFFVNLICCVLAFLVISHFVVGPVQKMMDKRRDIIEKGLEDAKTAATAKSSATAEAAKILDEAQKQRDAILKQAAEDAEKLKVAACEKAESEMEKKQEAMEQETLEEREHILADLRGQIADLSVSGAKRIVEESLLPDEAKEHEILDEMLTGMKNGKFIDLSVVPAGQKKIEVTTALPLTIAEKKHIEIQLSEKLADDGEIKYFVSPEILGGVILRCSDKLIDASILGKSKELREAMN